MSMIQRDDGMVAIKWVINPNGKTVKIDNTDIYYVFVPQNHVVLAWVNSEHVDRLLSVRQKTCNCAGGVFKQAFEYANMIDVNVFTYNNRHGDLTMNYREVDSGI